MQLQWKLFILLFVAVIVTACEALGVPPHSTAPAYSNQASQSLTSTPSQLTFPQMPATALAVPTVIYPTNTPLSPEALFDLSQSKSTSPNGNYVITCDYAFPTLFYAPTKPLSQQ